VALVAGGAGDIGRGVCRALRKDGATVVVLDIEPSGAQDATRVIECDLTDPVACRDAVDAVVRDFGGVATLVNLAQKYVTDTAVLDLTPSDLTLSFDTGPQATLRMMQLCHPHLKARGGGAIINFASGSGTSGAVRQAAYAAAKEAIRGLTKTAALEWGPDNIRVNAVCPVATGKPETKVWVDWFRKESPLRRIGDPESDIGSVVVFLAGPGSFMTGRTLHVDGGMGTFR
jgi:NAD(P)-dependent dehydrogenase (short-subunit alcohol dehydrogenase family)